MPKIYISPARHPEGQNLDVHGRSERQRMAVVGKKLFDALAAKGYNAMILNDELDLTGAVKQSDTWGADLHIALHSNAANGAASGMEAWVHRNNENMERLTHFILDRIGRALAQQLPIRRGQKGWAKRSLVDPPWVPPRYPKGLYEVEKTRADAILLEFYFHDNPHDCAVWAQYENAAVEALAAAIDFYYKNFKRGG